jgi:hypothetical protein
MLVVLRWASCKDSSTDRDSEKDSVRAARALIKYNLILYQNKFITALENFNKIEKNGNLFFKAYQMKRIADELTDICIIIKNVVNSSLLLISLLLFADINIVPC